MSKPLKTQGKSNAVPQTSNLMNAAAPASIEGATPLAFPARSPARATKGGASPRHSLCPSVRPHTAFSAQHGVEK